jgi:UDP-N-acetylmuramyl pentapeptide phosphotransferase/UDP-N-acetylglucosamine-1-phosphate transferase
MATQSFERHAHRPTMTIVGGWFLAAAIVAFALRWFLIGGRVTMAIGLGGLIAAVAVLLSISRVYTTGLQDRIIRLEMRVRGVSLLSPEQQRTLAALRIKQVVALRFASDAELPALLERAAREQLSPTDIKRAIKEWVPDLDRT